MKTKKGSIETNQKRLHVDLQALGTLMDILTEELDGARKTNKQHAPQSVNENRLLTKLCLLIETKLQEYSDSRLVIDILQQNEMSIKGLDNFLNQDEKENRTAFEEEKKLLDLQIIKQVTVDYDKKYMNDGELETSEEKFWGKMEEYRQKNKKKGTQVANLTTSKAFSTQVSSMNTEQTDDSMPEMQDQFPTSIMTTLKDNPNLMVNIGEVQQKRDYLESEKFVVSRNNPYNENNNQMTSLLVPEFSNYQTQLQSQLDQSLISLRKNSSKMRLGNESQRDVIKALKYKKKQELNSQKQGEENNQEQEPGTQSEWTEEEEEAQIEDDENENDDEDNEDGSDYSQDEDSLQIGQFISRNKEIDQNVMEYVRRSNSNLVEITDEDIDFEINKANSKKKSIAIRKSSKGHSNSRSASAASRKIEEVEEENQEEDEEENFDNEVYPVQQDLEENPIDFKDEDLFDNSVNSDSDQDNNLSSEEDMSEDDDDNRMQDHRKKLKLKVPYTQYSNSIENSFMQFLKQSLSTQDEEESNKRNSQSSAPNSKQQQQQKQSKKPKHTSIKQIFQDNRATYIYGDSFALCSKANFWIVIQKREAMKRVMKTTRKLLTLGFAQQPLPFERKKMNAAEVMSINF